MNRWHVYTHLKQTFMYSGQVPTRYEVIEKFGKEMSEEELEEGILEFEMMANVTVKSTPDYKWTLDLKNKHYRRAEKLKM